MRRDLVTMATDDQWFSARQVAEGVHLVRERFYHSGNQANIWVVQGTEQDVVVDTGLGIQNLRGFLEEQELIGNKPTLAVATHVHFDHSGGLYQFPEVAIHKNEVEALENGNNYETVTFVSDSEIVPPPTRKWKASNYRVRATKVTRVLEEGDVINLGDRRLQVLHVPGHSRGSIVLHDQVNRQLFSGDTVYMGSLIDWLPYSCVSDYVQSCRRLQTLAPDIDTVFPGHFETFSGQLLENMLTDYINSAGVFHRATAGVIGVLSGVVLRGRNTNNIPAKCCFYGCCCHCCV
ncbi:metallo-beta-lactamase domain-containing protein 2-like isoform X3 [Branchiostoma floridae]|nr:metallo-beta-lactamase domain-containing protein 2-like isoform X3 [Branchiostoma floridae]XP_035688570.1 metallo-beta-lactamase domain-containing protein 2-like isoform X3 [Branchiostoma floridae]XP_035688571.1 metallo-beta-lactamase domain-containing protein 2-like isoform X3 [Branchiostoma floridae]